jgi:hypothetical protein
MSDFAIAKPDLVGAVQSHNHPMAQSPSQFYALVVAANSGAGRS